MLVPRLFGHVCSVMNAKRMVSKASGAVAER